MIYGIVSSYNSAEKVTNGFRLALVVQVVLAIEIYLNEQAYV